MSTSIYIVSLVLATALGFGYFSESSVAYSDTGQKAQIVLAALCLMLAVYAWFAASFLTALLLCGVEAAGIFTGKVVAETLDRS